MRNTVAIMQRELLSLFFSPIGYVVLAGFLALTGAVVLWTESFGPGKPADLRHFFGFMPYLLTLIVPAVTMRTLAEENRSGTIESLMTAPVSDAQLVIGKYLGALLFYLVMLAGTFVYLILLMIFGNPDMGTSLSAYLGLLLLGTSFTAFGVLVSSLWRDQIVAWMVAAVPLTLFVWPAMWIVGQLGGVWRDMFQYINIARHLDLFNRGLVTTESVAFFLASAGLFLFLTVKVVESRRWR